METFGKFFCSAPTNLIRVVRQLAEYRLPEKFKIDTEGDLVDLCKKVVLGIFGSTMYIMFLPVIPTNCLAMDAH